LEDAQAAEAAEFLILTGSYGVNKGVCNSRHHQNGKAKPKPPPMWFTGGNPAGCHVSDILNARSAIGTECMLQKAPILQHDQNVSD